jgi:hypothetical protein
MNEQIYDYGISAVHYEEDRIESAKVHKFNKDGTLGDPEVWKVGEIIDEIEQGKTFVTVVMGAAVGEVASRTEFIRTYPRDGIMDNLGGLPRFNVS